MNDINKKYNEEKQYHPEAEDGDTVSIGIDGNGTALDYGHVIQEGRCYDYDEVDGIRFTTYCDTDDMHENVAEELKEQFPCNTTLYDAEGIYGAEYKDKYIATNENNEVIKVFEEQEYKELENQFIKENCEFDIAFYNRDYEYIGEAQEPLSNLEEYYTYSNIPDEYIELILNEFNSKLDYFDGDYRIDEVKFSLYTDDDDIYAAAKKLYPTYDEYFQGLRGFILQDGTIVGTEAEHNEITWLKGVESKFQFIEMGNIRIMPNSIDIGQEPTSSQESILKQMIRCYSDDELYIDLSDRGNNACGCKYVCPDYRRVMADIYRYYSEGMKPLGESKKPKKIYINEEKLQLLKETHESVLYHITHFHTLPFILAKGLMIGGYVDFEGNTDEDIYNPRISQFKDKSSSLTRVSNFNIHPRNHNFVRLTINGNALQNRGDVIIKPVYAFKGSSSPTKFSKDIWKDDSEKEERVWKINDRHHDGDYLSNPQNYITSIDIFYSEDFELQMFQKRVLPQLPEWAKDILHIYDYDKFNYPIRLKENIESEISPDEVDTSSFKIQNELQPEIWKDKQLNPQLRLKLLDIADDFFNTLNINWVKPIDIILTGSICNFNWSQYSDIDLHIIIDFKKVSEQTDFVQTFVDSKKNEWNDQHTNLEIFGFPVELYVQDVNAVNISSGVYSLEKDEWIQEPSANEMEDIQSVDSMKIKIGASSIMTLIDDIEEEFNTTTDKHQLEILNNKIDHLSKKLKELRQNGLDETGEMSVPNLIYKVLRRTEYLNKMWELSEKIYDKINSIN